MPVLAIDKHYTLGLAIKRAIRNFGPYWEARCREIFHEDPAYDEPDDPATSMLYDEVNRTSLISCIISLQILSHLSL